MLKYPILHFHLLYFLQTLQIITLHFKNIKFVKLINTMNVFLNPLPYHLLYNFNEVTNFQVVQRLFFRNVGESQRATI